MYDNKKGVSPLIATVLLIGFAVALAAVVMTWGLDFIRNTAEATETQTERTLICASDLSFRIDDVGCAGAEEGFVSIDNRGQVDIVSFVIRVHTADGGVSSFNTAELLGPDDEILGGADKFELRVFKHLDMDIALMEGNGADLVEVVATVRGDEGEPDIICPQNIQDYHIVPLC